MVIVLKKDYGTVKSFRLYRDDQKLLNECFDMLHITADSFNAKMVYFIGRVHEDLQELRDLRKKVGDQQKQIKDLKNKVPLPIKETEKPQPTKSEAVTPIQTTQKATVYYAKEHRELEKQITQPKEYFTCQLDHKAYEILKLPCIDNPLFRCHNKLCEKQVMNLIR